MVSVDWGAATDVGLRRQLNEDSHLATGQIFLVADGMGGHAAGEVASRIVVDTFTDAALNGLGPSGDGSRTQGWFAEDVTATVLRAHRAIVEHAESDQDARGMGTTVAGLAVVLLGGSEHWAVFNVGDSRVYRLSEGALSQVTVDHSEVAELVAGGLLDPEQARVDHRRNIITRSLGSEVLPQVDLWVFPPVPGEQFLICSDGLTGELTDDGIAERLLFAPDAATAAQTLVDDAVQAGGRDNVTAVVVEVIAGQDEGVDEDTSPRSSFGHGSFDDTTPRDPGGGAT